MAGLPIGVDGEPETFDFTPRAINWSEEGKNERIYGELVTDNYVDVLGVEPPLGRSFAPEPNPVAGAHPVVVLSHAFWKSRFGGDEGIPGRAPVAPGPAGDAEWAAELGWSRWSARTIRTMGRNGKAAVNLLLLAALAAACEGPTSTNFAAGGEPASAVPAEQALGKAKAQEFAFQRILCFGDSLTYGTTLRVPGGWGSLAPVEGYVPKLERMLAARYGSGIDLINSGVGGETVLQGLERLKRELPVIRPDLVLLLEGAVDIGEASPRYERIRRNLRRMMTEVQNRGTAVIIGTVPPFHPDGFRAGGLANVPVLNEIIRDEARALGVPVADHARAFGGDPGLQGPDGVHPNDNGYVVMAETWLAAIENLIDPSTS